MELRGNEGQVEAAGGSAVCLIDRCAEPHESGGVEQAEYAPDCNTLVRRRRVVRSFIMVPRSCTWAGEGRKLTSGRARPERTAAPTKVRGTEPGNVAWS